MERIVLLLLNLFVSSTSGSLISQFFNDVAPESQTLISFGKNDHPNLWVQTPSILLSTFDIDPCLLQKVRDTIVTSATLIGYVKNNEDIKQLQKVQKYLQISRSYIINLQSGLVDANIFSEHETWIINLQSDKNVEVAQFCPNLPSESTKTIWNPTTGFLIPFSRCRVWLDGRTIEVCLPTAKMIPFMFKNAQSEAVGVDLDVLKILSKQFHFEYKFHVEQFWGRLIEGTRNSYLGIVGRVANDSAKFGVGALLINHEHYQVTDYTGILYAVEPRYISRRPETLAPYFNLLKPFPYQIWLIILGSVALLLWFYVGFHYTQNGLSRSLLLAWGLIFSQSSSSITYRTISGRMFMTAYLGFTFFIMSMFECNLRAYLLDADLEPALDFEADILAQGRSIMFAEGTPFSLAYKNSDNPLRRQLWEGAIQNNHVYKDARRPGLKFEQRIFKENGAALYPYEVVLGLLPELEKLLGPRPFHISKEAVMPYFAALMIPKYQSWTDEIVSSVYRLREGGIIQQLIYRYIDPKYVLQTSNEPAPVPFKLDHFLAGYVFLVGGLFLACVIFLWEYFRGKKVKSFIHKKTRSPATLTKY